MAIDFTTPRQLVRLEDIEPETESTLLCYHLGLFLCPEFAVQYPDQNYFVIVTITI